MMISNKYRGMMGEWAACMYLRLKGWQILHRNLKHPLGELDIVARKNESLCVVEVKWRKHGQKFPSVSLKQQERIKRSFSYFLEHYPKRHEITHCHIDLIIITPPCHIRHIQNAFA